jgi:hypothetical protein
MDNDREFMHMLKKHGHVDSDNRVDLNTIGDYSHIRAHAKNLNQSVEAGYLDGHLGLVIQGTGKDLDDVTKHKTYLESFGYDTFCVFINTSLEVSLARNRGRKRVMPDEVVKKSWENAQHNIGSFQNLFGNGNFIVFDNTNADKTSVTKLFKDVVRWLNQPVKNPIGKKWERDQIALKNRKI